MPSVLPDGAVGAALLPLGGHTRAARRPESPLLLAAAPGGVWGVWGRVLAIGRRKKCWLRLLEDLEVSSVHAELQLVADEGGNGRVVLRDVKSTNGTKLNGTPLVPRQDYPLADGDLVGVGRTRLRFVLVLHEEQCGGERVGTGTDAVSRGAVAVASGDAEKAVNRPVAVATGSDVASATTNGVCDEKHNAQPAGQELAFNAAKPVMQSRTSNEIDLTKDDSEVVIAVANGVAVNGGGTTRRIVDNSMEDATCTNCGMLLGQLNMLEQQAHLNSCLGGRAAPVAQAAVSTTSDAKPKSRKRGNTASGTTRAKKARKPKQDNAGAGSTAPTKTAKKTRKRKKVAEEEDDIELALALAPSSTLSKEEQTDIKLAAAVKKLEILDVQLARLSKRRVNLVKTMERLEKTKEKLRKSQVLPPGRVRELLDLEAALRAIFPGSRQAQSMDQSKDNEQATKESDVAKRYAPARCRESRSADVCESTSECDEEKRAELAVVATISMWARASQQLFGLQRSSLLYRNNVLRTFLGDDEDVVSDIGSNEDIQVVEEDEREPETEFVPVVDGGEDASANWMPDSLTDPEVPDVVKRVFPDWRRDVAFLYEQTPDELEMALETINEAQKRGLITDSQFEGVQSVEKEEFRAPATKADQRLACEYMAQIMARLISEKRERTGDNKKPATAGQQQQSVIDLASLSEEEVLQQGVSDNEVEEEPYNPALEELPKAVIARDPACISSAAFATEPE